MNRSFPVACALFVAFAAVSASAATFVVPPDRDLVRQSDAIVVASALGSYCQHTAAGGIETVTTFSIEEAVKGASLSTEIDVHEPGGTLGDTGMMIPGVPRFPAGRRVVLFLSRTPQKTWAVTDLVLGKFTFLTDTAGRHLLVRDEGEINGWDPDGSQHSEGQRSADRFLAYLRAEAGGQNGNADYYVRHLPLVANSVEATIPRKIASNFTGTSYTSDAGSGRGSRWNVFPSSVTFYNENTESGAQGGGVTAIQAGLNAWTNDGGSNVSYVYGGTDSGHTNGLSGADGRNTVQFDRNLTGYGAPAFTCSSNSYSGVLGIGGITLYSGTHSANGETYWTTQEVDVEMNQGIANCTLLLTTNAGDWNSALTHEIGHTLGLRHSDQTRADDPNVACSTDPSLECAAVAIMHSSVSPGLNASLTTWDQHAVDAIYGSCTPPGISSQPQATPSTIASGSSSQLSVTATGTSPTYQWYSGSPGNTSSPVGGGTTASIMVSPTSTTSYWVRVSGACGSPVDSQGVTVTVTACVPPGISSQPQATPSTIASGSSSQLSVTATGTSPTYQWYVGAPGNTSSPVGGGTTASIMVSPTSTTSYWVRVSGACAPSVDSQGVTVTVTGCSPPGISQQPQAAPSTITSGGSSQLSVTATGTSPTYQWYVGSPGNTSSPVGGGTTASIMVSPTSTTSYWVRVSGSCGSPVDSQGVTVTVSAGCTSPSINQQPLAQPPAISTGQSSQLSVGGAGTATLTYQWYVGQQGNTTSPVAGGTSAIIMVAPSTTTTYWVRITNGCGQIDSNTVTVTVSNGCAPPNVLVQPNDQSVTPGTVSLFVGYTGSTGTVTWYQGTAPDQSHSVGTGQTLQIAVTATTQFWAQIVNSCGFANSRTATITVTQSCVAPGVTSAAGNPTTVAPSAASQLSVTATGTSLTYQWYRGNQGDTTNPIGGATSATTTVNPTATTSYWVRVSNSCGHADSSTITITVSTQCAAPAISTQPLSSTIISGQHLTLSVIASGGTLTYQWYWGPVDDTSTPVGTNSSTLDIGPTFTTSFWVKVTNSCGSTKSTAAVITVNPAKHRAVRH